MLFIAVLCSVAFQQRFNELYDRFGESQKFSSLILDRTFLVRVGAPYFNSQRNELGNLHS